MWTKFWDMNSGGGQKEDWRLIFIEAPEAEARVIFYNSFGHNPDRVTCTCCGEDYSVNSDQDLAQLSAFHRDCGWSKEDRKYVEMSDKSWKEYLTLDEFEAKEDVLIIRASEIEPGERLGSVPEQGYVWKE